MITLSEEDAAGLLELVVYCLTGLMLVVLVVWPLILRGNRLTRALRGSDPMDDEEDAGQAGLIKVAVWVPEANAGHLQALARQLRRNGGIPDTPPEEKK